MHPTVFANVSLGAGVHLQGPCVVGQPPLGRAAGELPTVVGAASLIRSFAVIYAGSTLGERVAVGHGVLIRESNTVGDDTSVGTNAVLEGRCSIGRRVRIHSQCFLESVVVEDDVFIGPNVTFTDDPHPPCPMYVECGQGVTVRSRAKIGGGALLLPGVTVGEGSLVGGGAVVTNDVPPEAVVAGNPARVINRVADLDCFAGFFSRPFEWEVNG
jgi:UDP-2-acetamido-3-amino-2,3-dideoxy-glucuronate N-acetyltransferase